MSVAQRLDSFINGSGLALVALLPYRPVVALARRLDPTPAGPPSTAALARLTRLPLLDDWDAEGALADLQRSCLGA